MIRPALVLLCGAACGKVTNEHIRAAAILQMIHNATLLHDDVIDQAKSRRGLTTVNRLYGNESAILLGDLLLSRVFRMCVELDSRISSQIAAAAARTCEGELRQVLERGNWNLSQARYIATIADKTAALFRCACSAGAMLAGSSEIESLAEYGQNAGIAFQITDDLLDITGNENHIGKTLGSDVDNHKLTLPLIYFFRSADRSARRDVLKLLSRRWASDKRTLAGKLAEYGCLEYGRRVAQRFIKKAIDSIARLPQTQGKETLIETANFIIERTA